VDELHFEGDPETNSTRRRLERILRAEEQPRSEWRWVAALAAGATALLFWQVRRRRGNGHAADGAERASQRRADRERTAGGVKTRA
jgi:hypothetical protein